MRLYEYWFLIRGKLLERLILEESPGIQDVFSNPNDKVSA
jgi:hypothetical protein